MLTLDPIRLFERLGALNHQSVQWPQAGCFTSGVAKHILANIARFIYLDLRDKHIIPISMSESANMYWQLKTMSCSKLFAWGFESNDLHPSCFSLGEKARMGSCLSHNL